MRVVRHSMRTGRLAFTLVELLIVVVILGILAAVVIPQFQNASEDTKLSALTQNLRIVRQQLEVYKMQHMGSLPTLDWFVDQMTGKTKINGKPDSAGQFGPYLISIPKNPFSNPPTNSVTKDGQDVTQAWYYDETTGDFRALDGGKSNGIAHWDL